jgi:hypothetical protein
MGECGFTESGGAIKEKVFEWFPALFRGVDQYAQIFFYWALTDVFVPLAWP